MKKDYILITPVHNEEEFLEDTIKSVVSQSIQPKKWLIVDDASEDRTPQIITKYQKKYDFVDYLRLKRGDIESYYSRRVYVFLAGYDKVKKLEFDFIAALDADLELSPGFYEGLLAEFDRNEKLGVASGVYLDLIDGQPRKVLRSDISTSGGLQIFRRECYELIGGYTPLKYGGDDSLAEYTARMKGWQSRSFSAYTAIHKRPVGTKGGACIVKARYRQGMADYYLGTHILFMIAKTLRRAIMEKPYITGSLSGLTGYIAANLSRERRIIPKEIIKYIHKEQLKRMFNFNRISENKRCQP